MSTPEFMRKAIQGLGFLSDEQCSSIDLVIRQDGPAVVRTSGDCRWSNRNEAEKYNKAERLLSIVKSIL